MNELIKLYNPANAGTLTPEELEGLQKLDSAQIKELALAYPNAAMQRAYLLIIDNRKPADKQLPALSSYENLWNLREKNGLRNYVAYSFRGTYRAKTVVPFKQKRTEVLDLSEVELMNLPGFKKSGTPKPVTTFTEELPAEPLQVKVTKIKKVPVKKSKK